MDFIAKVMNKLLSHPFGSATNRCQEGNNDVLQAHVGRPRCFDPMIQNIILPKKKLWPRIKKRQERTSGCFGTSCRETTVFWSHDPATCVKGIIKLVVFVILKQNGEFHGGHAAKHIVKPLKINAIMQQLWKSGRVPELPPRYPVTRLSDDIYRTHTDKLFRE